MHNKRFTHNSTNSILVLVLVLLAGNLVFIAASRAKAEGDGVNGPETAVAAINSAFTYQGSLEDGNGPVNGACDMQFGLYDAASGGSQTGLTLTKSSVTVSDGLFTVELNFGDQFTGDARYLQIAVRCPAGSGNFTTLNGRVALNAAPYALSLRPGANVQGSDTSNRILGAVNTAASGSGAGLYGEARSSGGAGVSGWNISSSGGGYAVYGNNSANSGVPYGVYGIASDNGSATSYGVYGESNSSVGTGVGGSAPTNGVYGEAANSSGTTWGVYGKSNSASGYGVYSNGNAHVEGNLTWKPVTSYLSIPAAALQPNDEAIEWDFTFSGHFFYSSGDTYYVVPVFLPHNATVTEITTWWTDTSASDATIALRRADPDSWDDMATLSTAGDTGNMLVSSETAFTNPVIDNSQYSYFLYIALPDSNISYYQTVIEYTTTTPH